MIRKPTETNIAVNDERDITATNDLGQNEGTCAEITQVTLVIKIMNRDKWHPRQTQQYPYIK